jgi:undecaprenyl-diphosphatase
LSPRDKAQDNKINHRLVIGTGILGALAVVTSVIAHWVNPFPGDLKFVIWFQSFHSAAFSTFVKAATWVAEGWQQVIFVIVVALIVWRYIGKLEAALTAAAGLSTIFIAVPKWIVGRSRPSPDQVSVWAVLNNNGFPSGHAFFSMVFFGLIIYFIVTYIDKSVYRSLTIAFLIFLIIIIGASRVYLGVHWPSDVLGGYLFGGTFLGLFILLHRRLMPKKIIETHPIDQTATH